VSVPEASTLSAKIVLLPGAHAGAVSCTLYVQVSPGMPLGCSVVTAFPATVQGIGDVVPPGKGTVFVTERLTTVNAWSKF
jgi:hypothetical protein